MNKFYVAIFCVLFSLFALPASAQEAPETETGDMEQETSIQVVEGTDGENYESDEASASIVTIVQESTETDSISQDSTDANEPDLSTSDSTLETSKAQPPTIYISEINWAGSILSSADEWIELYNADSQSVDLSGWVLTGSATGGESLMIAEGTNLESGLALLISNYKLGDKKTTLAIAPDLITSALSLPNTKLEIILAMADGTVVDEISDSGTPDFGSSDPKASMVRNLATLEWMTEGQSVNLFDKTQLGTPGVVYLLGGFEEIAEEETMVELTEDEIVIIELETPEPIIEEVDQSSDVENQNNEVAEIAESEESVENSVEEAEDITSVITDEIQPDEQTELNELETESELETPQVSDNSSSQIVLEEEDQEPVSFSIGTLVITEFVSDPEDGVEWIEIYNPGSEMVSLTDWSITDATDKKTAFDQFEIQPKTYIVIENPKGKLNNSADEIKLYDPSGNLIDQVTYTGVLAPNKGESLVRNQSDQWEITNQLTKGTKNSYVEQTQTAETDSNAKTESGSNQKNEQTNVSDTEQTSASNDSNVSSQTETHRVIAIAEKTQITQTKKASSSTSSKASTTSSNKNVTITGTITALPGTFGSQIAYIDGTQLYFYYADWPELVIGDVVTITGVESSNRGEDRLKISDKNSIQIVKHAELTPESMTVFTALASDTGSLISVVGLIAERNGSVMIIKDETGELTVVAHGNSDIAWSSIENARVQITGVMRNMNGEMKLYPRSVDDIVQIQTSVSPDNDSEVISGRSNGNSTPWVGLGLLGACVGALTYWFFRNQKLNNLKPITDNR